MIYALCIRYSFCPQDVEDNYIEVLTNMYKYIDTYDTSKSIHTWLHIVTKRCVFEQDTRRKKQRDTHSDDCSVDSIYENNSEDLLTEIDSVSANAMNLENYKNLYSDDVLYALAQLKPHFRRALLLQQAGYKLKEIAEIEHNNGALESHNIETIKSRLFLARQQLQELLTRDGKRRENCEAN